AGFASGRQQLAASERRTMPRHRYSGQNVRMRVAGAIVLILLMIAPVVLVLGLFVWAASRDGQEDRAVRARLGIRRRTRSGH
ncbi:MAG: hypothetical protein ACJ74B_02690, partial [Gaiellaceae bacterium]